MEYDITAKIRRGLLKKPAVPKNHVIRSLNALLTDIYVRHVALDPEEFYLYYDVFIKIYNKLHNKMKMVDQYYRNYSSTVQFGGSHSNKLRIKKPDEFDIDVVIDFPVNINTDSQNPECSDFVIESQSPEFTQLKMGHHFRNLVKRERWSIHKTAYKWKDRKHYLLSSKFLDWFKGVVAKALRASWPLGQQWCVFKVQGVCYQVFYATGGPAITLHIVNEDQGFKMTFDLVPTLKFPESRWPPSGKYRMIPRKWSSPQKVWMVVPKQNMKAIVECNIKRSWRCSLPDQEKRIMHNLFNMKQSLRLIKKLRDSLEMNKIASYHIKTLFLREISRRNRNFWRQSPAELFKHMVKNFYNALLDGEILFFWNSKSNMIDNINKITLEEYRAKLAKLLTALDDPIDLRTVAKCLLTNEEIKSYNFN